MLNVKPESCEYQLLKSFSLTQPGNRTLVYRLLSQKQLNFIIQRISSVYFSVENMNCWLKNVVIKLYIGDIDC